MDAQGVISIAQQALYATVLLSAPMLLTSLVVGLVVSILQAATQINEMTLTFIPKLLAIIAAIVIAGPWMVTYFVDFVRRLYEGIPAAIG
ncbi:flagellar biosynthetic protein FliQ [Burkholderiales bacterium GJ-E10]|nr:flagellar biosynthetic protein FliQ [Burkholderiales bacterium GJ-E10]